MQHTLSVVAALGFVRVGAAAAVGLVAGRAIRLAEEHEVPGAAPGGRDPRNPSR